MSARVTPGSARRVRGHITAYWDTLRGFARARVELRNVTTGARVRCYGRIVVEGGSGITIGSRVLFSGGIFPTELRCEEGATLRIGSWSMLNYGVSIVASQSVRIGERCMFGSLVHVRDDDGRTRGPVTIGNDVWIAHGAIIEPGSTIGDGSVVAAGAVVRGDVPPRMLAIGNPANCVPLETPPVASGPHSRDHDSAREGDREAGPGEIHEAIENGIARVASSHDRAGTNDVAPDSAPPQTQSSVWREAHGEDDAPSPPSHSRGDVRAAIIGWLDDTRHFGEAEGLIPNDSVSLRERGLLDSLGLVQLVLMLEKRFDVKVDRDLVARPSSQSVSAFIDAVVGYSQGPSSKTSDRPEAAVVQALHEVDPSAAAASQLSAFAAYVSAKTGQTFGDYAALHAFSIGELETFWSLFVAWSGIVYGGETEPVCVGSDVIESARFFPAMRLSWSENLLAEREDEDEAAVALIACDETGARTEISRPELRRRVRAVAAALDAMGLREGDRVAAIARNTAETVIACLAVTSLGATWSSVAPDMGLETALNRFAQVEPTILFAHREASLNGVRIAAPVERLAGSLPSLKAIVALEGEKGSDGALTHTTLSSLEETGAKLPLADRNTPWRRFAFDHPLFVLFSSGTTGAPKCIVHSHGGTLLEHLKEHRLHGNLGPSDRLLFQTSTGWMMWNWTVSAIATGAAVVLYDGSVSYPQADSLLQIVAGEKVTVFGTSPAYLQYLVDANVRSGPSLLTGVREMLSTGSVLYAHLHRWGKEHLANVPLQSISGGTDILGCFVLGSPWTATFEGKSSCIGLGLDVRSFTASSDGTPETRGIDGRGELVCARPFPSRPVGFLKDPDGTRFHEAYFAQHEGLWTHGDLIDLSPTGTVQVLGRSDGVLNIRGIRIGPGEIYTVLASEIPEVSQAMAVDQEDRSEAGGRRLVLFVVLKEGTTLDRPLVLRMKKELMTRASPAHVPAAIVQVSELPTTFSGKRSEASLQDALSGRAVRNRSPLRNPVCVDDALLALKRVEAPPAAQVEPTR